MSDAVHAVLNGWDSFYVIIGSSGGALIGLQFVVIALLKEMRGVQRSAEGISAFATPTVIHFGGALVIAALMSAPWPSVFSLAFALVVGGLVGLWFCVRAMLHARGDTGYTMVLEDRLFHVILPFVAYGVLILAAVLLGGPTRFASFAIAGSSLALLIIAIHNAWDTVTYFVLNDAKEGARHE